MIERLAICAMGTRFEMALSGASSPVLRAAGEAAFDEVLHLHRLWSAFDPGSLLTRVNRLAAGRGVAIDGETFAILALARELWEQTQGAFDPTMGGTMRALGHRSQGKRSPGKWAQGERDTAGSSREPTPSPGMAAVELDADLGTVRFLDPSIELDLGGLAKGVAIDRVGASLRESGVPCALVSGGTSSVLAIGTPPDSEGWPIALDADGKLPCAHLRDVSLGVSAGSGRVAKSIHGLRGHVIDPERGTPAPLDRWAAVVADSAAVADAWATALIATERSLELPPDFSVLVGGTDGDRSGAFRPAIIERRQDPRGVFRSRAISSP